MDRHFVDMMNQKNQIIGVYFYRFWSFMLVILNMSRMLCWRMLQRINKMTSPGIQKDIVHALVIVTTKLITTDIGDDFFAILADESRDVSVKEQMGVILCYVDGKGCVIERFLGISHVRDTKAMSLKIAIESMLMKNGLSISRVRGQGYDGASNMKGQINGLKTLILEESPFAYYIHCFAHRLQFNSCCYCSEP
ncbi:Zinc finger MYM-type protein 1 [Linum perenne]